VGLASRYIGTIYYKKNKTLLPRHIECDYTHWVADMRYPALETPEMRGMSRGKRVLKFTASITESKEIYFTPL
jgi:hypothetical protein